MSHNHDNTKVTDHYEKWSHSIAIQIPVIFDGRFKSSLAHAHKGIKLMSELFCGSRFWLELGSYYINNQERFGIDLNVWVKSQMDDPTFYQHRSKVLDLALQMRDKLRQEAIVIEIDGNMECHWSQ